MMKNKTGDYLYVINLLGVCSVAKYGILLLTDCDFQSGPIMSVTEAIPNCHSLQWNYLDNYIIYYVFVTDGCEN